MLNAIDLFCGCGGITQGLKNAGFKVLAGVEFNPAPAAVYQVNHPEVRLFQEDITKLGTEDVISACGNQHIHLLAGCPPCQGFSTIRRKNKSEIISDPRNMLAQDYLRYVKAFMPDTILFENVPGIENYPIFVRVRIVLSSLGYKLDCHIVDFARYGVPQRRKRFVMIGSRVGKIQLGQGSDKIVTVKDTIGSLESPEETSDYAHTIYAHNTPRILDMIRHVPHDGGSRADLPEKYVLNCHKKEGIGFKDVYGRLRWDSVSSTITGGCLNPSKGRFLHPEQDRALTVREAAMLQTFPPDYIFPKEISKTELGLMIGNAVPPRFAQNVGKIIIDALRKQKDQIGFSWQ